MLSRPIYLFLDFDGVLHASIVEREELMFCHADVLGRALEPFPTVQVIVSSTWRLGRDLEELRAMCGPLLGPRLIGVTPELTDPRSPRDLKRPIWRQRFQEIAAWLAIHAPNGDVREAPESRAAAANARNDWIALDDAPALFPHPCSQLVVIGACGLTAADVHKIRARLEQLTNRQT